MKFKDPKLLPYKWIAMIDPLDRKALNLKTEDEMAKAWTARNERELQRQIVTYLREHRGIEVIWHGTHKKSTATKGCPDILFSVMVNGFPRSVAIEVKFGSGTCSTEQNDIHKRMQMRPNAWDVRIVRSFPEIVDLMREFGL